MPEVTGSSDTLPQLACIFSMVLNGSPAGHIMTAFHLHRCVKYRPNRETNKEMNKKAKSDWKEHFFSLSHLKLLN